MFSCEDSCSPFSGSCAYASVRYSLTIFTETWREVKALMRVLA